MPIDPAQLARSLGDLGSLDAEQGLAVTLPQVLRAAKTLLAADRARLMLVDRAGVLRWASASDPMVETPESELLPLAHGPCRAAFAQRAPVAVPGLAGAAGRRTPARVGIDAGNHGTLSVPVQVAGGPVGTLDVRVAAPREWDDSEAAALQAYAGLVASLLAAAMTARVTGRLADQLRAALEHRSLIEQAVQVFVDREGLDAAAAFEWLATAARSSASALVQMAGAVVDGAPLPSDRLASAKEQRREATDREVAMHRRTSEVHEGAARRYQRRGQPGRAQTERLQAAAARGRIIDAEAERRRAHPER
jgi:GAF domain-containing protein